MAASCESSVPAFAVASCSFASASITGGLITCARVRVRVRVKG